MTGVITSCVLRIFVSQNRFQSLYDEIFNIVGFVELRVVIPSLSDIAVNAWKQNPFPKFKFLLIALHNCYGYPKQGPGGENPPTEKEYSPELNAM